MRFVLRLIACFCCAYFGIVYAQHVAPGIPWELSQLQRKNWQIEDGLPHNYVTAITQDGLGRLLVGTKNGIVSSDGFTFDQYPLLADSWIYSLLLTPEGTLWVGTYQQGLYRIQNAQAVKIADGTFYSIIQGKDGRIWAVSSDGLGFIENDRYQMIIRGGNTGGFGWQPATQDEDKTIWFAAESGLFRYRAHRAVFMHVETLDGPPVTVYSSPHSHGLFVGTAKSLYRLICDQSICQATLIKGVRGPVVGIHQAFDNTIWVATWGNGLYRMSLLSGDIRIENSDHRSELGDDFVHAFFEDRERNLWIGTRGSGLTRFRTTVLKPFGIPEGVNGNCASAAIGDGEGGVWLGTWRSGLFHWRNGKMEAQILPRGQLNILINSLALDSAHNLWIGSLQGLFVLRHGQNRVQALTYRSEIDNEEGIDQIFFAADKSLWIVHNNGRLLVFPSGDPATSQAHAVLDHEHVTYVAQSTSGALWVGTNSGLLRMKNSNAAPEHIFTARSPLVSIYEDRRSRLWSTYQDGSIYVGTDAALAPFPSSQFPNRLIYTIMEDPSNNFWFTTGLGLVRITNDDIDLALKKPDAGIDAIHFGVADGARTIECRCADHPQSWMASNGTMWIPTAKGFIEANPHRIASSSPPVPAIKEIRWDGARPTQNYQVNLKAGSHGLEIQFSAVRLSEPQQVRFRYRIDGVDASWVEAGQSRIARYSELPPGHYHFQVAARDAIGSWSTPAQVIIDQEPYLYQRLWFKCMIGALLLLMTSAVYFAHLQSVRARYKAVLAERNRIARDWHDTLLSGLTAIAWQFDAAIRMCTQPTLLTTLKSVRGMLRYCSDEARRAVSDLRDLPLSSPDIATTLREILEQSTVGTGIHFDLHVDPTLPNLPDELRLNLSRICQEAITNAILHGRPSKIEVGLVSEDKILILRISDDGIGIDPSCIETPRAGHFGILDMRERADNAGGTFNLLGNKGRGTVVQIEVPISK